MKKYAIQNAIFHILVAALAFPIYISYTQITWEVRKYFLTSKRDVQITECEKKKYDHNRIRNSKDVASIP